MLYYPRRHCVVVVEGLGEVGLDPAIPVDSEDPDGAAIIDRWGKTHLRADSPVEQATAAPGEARTTRRSAA